MSVLTLAVHLSIEFIHVLSIIMLCGILGPAIVMAGDRAVMLWGGLFPAAACRLAHRTVMVLIVGSFSAACFPDPEVKQSNGGSDSSATASGSQIDVEPEKASSFEATSEVQVAEPEPRPRVFDFTLPESITLPESNIQIEDTEPSNIFDGQDLFGKEKKKSNVSLTVTPDMKAGDELSEVPEIEGGSIDVKVKTK